MLPQCWVRLLRLDDAEIRKAGLAIVKREPIDPEPEHSRYPKTAGLENIKSELLPQDNGDSPSVANLFIQNDNAQRLVDVESVLEGEKTVIGTIQKNLLKRQEPNCRPPEDLGYVMDHWWHKVTVNKQTLPISTKKITRRSRRVNKGGCFVIYQCKMCLKTYEIDSPCLLKHVQTHFCWVKLKRCNYLVEGRKEDVTISVKYVSDESDGSPRPDSLTDFTPEGIKKIKIDNNGDADTEQNIVSVSNSSQPTYESDSPCLLKHVQTRSCWVKLERCNYLAEGRKEDVTISVKYASDDESDGSPHPDLLADFTPEGINKIKIDNNGDADTKENIGCSGEENIVPGSNLSAPTVRPELVTLTSLTKKIKIENNGDADTEEKIVPMSNSCEPMVCPKFHMESTHSQHDETTVDTKPKICEIYQQIFQNELDLSLDQKSHDKVETKSPTGETTSNSETLVKLEPVPEFSCHLCDKTFHLKCLLEIHCVVHTKPLQSSPCPTISMTKYLRAYRRPRHFPQLEDHLESAVAGGQTIQLQNARGEEIPPFDLLTPCTSLQTGNILHTKSSLAINKQSSQAFNHSSVPQVGNLNELEPGLQTSNPSSVLEKHDSSQTLPNHGQRSLLCNECGKSFHKMRLLRLHLAPLGATNKSRCNLCWDSYTAYQNHIRTRNHVQIRRIRRKPGNECTVCREKFHRHIQPRRCMNIHTEIKSRSCKDCGKLMCPTKPKHSQNSKKKYRRLCHICGIHFKFSTHFCKHVQNKHPNKATEFETEKCHKCPVCPAAFKRVGGLRHHRCANLIGKQVAVHTENGCVCETCGKILGNQHAYDLHVRLHGFKEKCPCFCGASFMSKKKLARHTLQFHNPRHLFQCDSCSMTYETEDWLEAHKAAAHSSVELLRCETCWEWFTSAVLLRQHEESHCTVSKPRCRLCWKRFKDCAEYIAHLSQVHDTQPKHRCRHCCDSFGDLPELYLHVEEHEVIKVVDSLKIVVTQRLCDREGTLDYDLDWNN